MCSLCFGIRPNWFETEDDAGDDWATSPPSESVSEPSRLADSSDDVAGTPEPTDATQAPATSGEPALSPAAAAYQAQASISDIGTYLAYTSPSSGGGLRWATGGPISVNLSGLGLSTERDFARKAMAMFSQVANVKFVETSGPGQITFKDNGDTVNYDAYCSWSSSGSAITSAEIVISQKWVTSNGGYGGPAGIINSYGFQTYVHELGHALGLGHAGPYNGSATYGVDNVFANDSWQFTIMSYFSQTEAGGASFAHVTSAMAADILALQLLYGEPTAANSNRVFGYASDIGQYYDLSYSNSFTIYNSQHFATLNASLYAGAQTVNFDGGTASSIKGLQNNVMTATNTVVNKYMGGSGVDTIYLGGSASSSFAREAFGNAGDDLFVNNGGSGTGTASVTAHGGLGRDVFFENKSIAAFTFAHTSQWSGTSSGNGWVLSAPNSAYDIVDTIEVARFTEGDITLRQAKSNFNFGSVANDKGATSDVILQNGGTVVTWTIQNNVAVSGALIGAGVTGWTVTGTADINGDGDADVLLQNGGTIVAWNMQAGAVQSGAVIAAGVDGWAVKATGDINNDGTVDVIVQNGGTVVAWTMSNGVAKSGAVIGAGVANWTVVGSGDFFADGSSDVLLQNGGTVVVWNMLNGVVVGGKVLGAGVAGWTVKGTGDFNADGTTDVVLQNGGTIVDWLVKDGVATTGKVLATGVAGWNIVAVGDYNGDGTSDVMVQNGSTVVEWAVQNGLAVGGYVVGAGIGAFGVVG